MKRDYYTVTVPGDAFETQEQAADCAINEARERARIYAMPATWIAKLVKGDVGDWEMEYRVCRVRR